MPRRFLQIDSVLNAAISPDKILLIVIFGAVTRASVSYLVCRRIISFASTSVMTVIMFLHSSLMPITFLPLSWQETFIRNTYVCQEIHIDRATTSLMTWIPRVSMEIAQEQRNTANHKVPLILCVLSSKSIN